MCSGFQSSAMQLSAVQTSTLHIAVEYSRNRVMSCKPQGGAILTDGSCSPERLVVVQCSAAQYISCQCGAVQ